MYQEYFQLKSAPFSPTPDTHFYVENDCPPPLFQEMVEEVNRSNGFIRIVGDAGAGKTLHCRKLLNALHCHKKRYRLIHIPHPRLSEEGLLLAMAQELRISGTTLNSLRKDVICQLKQTLKESRVNVMVIDEGQTMPDDTLELLLELAELGDSTQQLLRVVLFTMPVVKEVQELPTNCRIQERVTLERTLCAFDREGMERYLDTRLQLAGYSGSPLYSKEALDALFNSTLGVPRLINLLAHKALVNTYHAKLQQVQGLQVRLAAAATEITPRIDGQDSPMGWFSRLRQRAI